MTYPFETERLGMSWFKNIIMYTNDPTPTNETIYNEWVDSMCVYILKGVTCSIRTNLEEDGNPPGDVFVIKQYING